MRRDGDSRAVEGTDGLTPAATLPSSLPARADAIVKGSPPTVAVAAKLFRSMCYSNKDRLLAGIIVAGWDAREGACCAGGAR